MPHERSHPILYALNVRVALHELGRRIGRAATLADIADASLDRFASLGITHLWLIGVWPTGPKSREIARSLDDLQVEYRRALPDVAPSDIPGSPYALAEYTVDSRIGGRDGLQTFRERLARRRIKLILDFVVNHTGLDHRWLIEHPDFYVQGGKASLQESPGEYFAVESGRGTVIVAHGRDPYMPPWTDTAQLNLFHPGARAESIKAMLDIASQCDGLRCDMAMLALHSVFGKTWGERGSVNVPEEPADGEFWRLATGQVRDKHPGFCFIAEAYWGLENALRMQGFDFTYDKTLYDRLIAGEGRSIHAHLQADPGWQAGTVRFLENHDESRIASLAPWPQHKAAAVVVATVPGMLMLHDGQIEGRKVRTPVQLARRRDEAVDEEVERFYEGLLALARDQRIREGRWRRLEVRPAWPGNPTWEQFIAYKWVSAAGTRVIVVNYGGTQGQCYVDVDETARGSLLFQDLLGADRYVRDGAQVAAGGLYLDMPAHEFHVFDVRDVATSITSA